MSENKDNKANIGCFLLIAGIIGVVILFKYVYTPEPDKFERISEKNMGYSKILIFQASTSVEEQEAINHSRQLSKGSNTSMTMIYFKNNATIPEELKENIIMDSYYFKDCIGIGHKPAQDSLNWHSGPIGDESIMELKSQGSN